MSGRPALALLLALALHLALAAASRAQDAGEPPEVTRMRESVPRLQRKLEELRGARFKGPVTVRYQTEQEFRAYVQGKLDAEYPPERARADARLLVGLGYLPEGYDLRQGHLDAAADLALAYYEPSERTFFVLRKAVPPTEVDAAVLHELHHALQDQHHDLAALLRPYEAPEQTNEDVVLALRCLVEGEAFYLQTRLGLEQQGMLAMLDQRLRMTANRPRRQMEAVERQALEVMGEQGKASLASLEARARLPNFINAQYVGPYFKGALWVHVLLGRGGWPLVDRLWTELPRSTEQVLHPEKLSGERHDPPTAVDLPDLSSTLGAPWRLVAEKTLGELLLRVWFDTLTGREQPAACAGWDGDLAQAYAGGDRTALLWFFVFDGPGDAAEFARAFDAARARGPDLMKTATAVVRDAHVLVLAGVPAEALDAVREAAFAGRTLR